MASSKYFIMTIVFFFEQRNIISMRTKCSNHPIAEHEGVTCRIPAAADFSKEIRFAGSSSGKYLAALAL